MPQFDFTIYPGLIFWLFVVFSVLYVAIRWVFLERIRGGIVYRKSTLDGWLEKAQELRNSAEELKKEDERKLKDARDEALVHVQSALADLKAKQQKEEQAILERLDQKRDEIRQEMQRTADAWQKDMGQLSSDLAENILSHIRENSSGVNASTARE